MRLMREIRFYADPQSTSPTTPLNTWAGTSPRTGSPRTTRGVVGSFRVLRGTLEGPIDARLGWFCDIGVIDELLRRHVQPLLPANAAATLIALADSLKLAYAAAQAHVPPGTHLEKLEFLLSPFTSFELERKVLPMVTFTQSFEFSASHRLFLEELSEEENRRIFGKCSNPHGHGHNYILEVSLTGEATDAPGSVVDREGLDRTVREKVILPYDHRNLNVECPEFARLNPTVENIARAIWNRLEGAFQHCRLSRVRVWETGKTYAEYFGD